MNGLAGTTGAAGALARRSLVSARALAPGLALALLVSAAASFVAETYGGPVMLFALLIGIALHFLTQQEAVGTGLDFASRRVLRLGVALLGLRIAFSDLTALGFVPVLVIGGGVALTIGSGLVFARVLGQPLSYGMLVGGATAICGASAALALAGVLRERVREREVAFAVVAVTTLSTIAMVIYPAIARVVGFSDHTTGVLLGATIHDVAQVVGAGYAVSEDAGNTATIVKLFRVALLLPTLIVAGLAFRSEARANAPLLPMFAVAFFVLMAINSVGIVPDAVALPLTALSNWCLIAAVSAIGLMTSLGEMFRLDRNTLLLPLATTGTLLLLVLVALMATEG